MCNPCDRKLSQDREIFHFWLVVLCPRRAHGAPQRDARSSSISPQSPQQQQQHRVFQFTIDGLFGSSNLKQQISNNIMISMIMVLNHKGDIMISRQYRYVRNSSSD